MWLLRVFDSRSLADVPGGCPLLVLSSEGLTEIVLTDRSFTLSRYLALWLPDGLTRIETWPKSPLLQIVALNKFSIEQPEGLLGLDNLARELVARAALEIELNAEDGRHRGIADLLTDSILKAKRMNTGIPLPKDERARRLFHQMTSGQGLLQNLEQLAAASGASKRTIERIIRRELGMSFSQWRQVVRVHQSLALLEQGLSVNQTATDVGYGSASAYINAFKKHMGISPRQFLKTERQ